MNIHLFSTITDQVTAVATCLSLLGVLVAILQLKDAQRWNRISNAFAQLPSMVDIETYESFLRAEPVSLAQRSSPMNEAEVASMFILQNELLLLKLKGYLNMLEVYCTAINHGVIEDKVAYSLFRHRFERDFDLLGPFIKEYRRKKGSVRIWDELERTVKRWHDILPERGVYHEPS